MFKWRDLQFSRNFKDKLKKLYWLNSILTPPNFVDIFKKKGAWEWQESKTKVFFEKE